VRVRPQRGMKDEVGHSFSIIDRSIRLARFFLSRSLARSSDREETRRRQGTVAMKRT
jgi:hypothetical protein